jgi:hypothetical protein
MRPPSPPGDTEIVTSSDRFNSLGVDVGTVRQWQSTGLTTAQFRALVRAGELVRLRPGVYMRAEFLVRVAKNPAFGHALQVAAFLVAQSVRGAVASHQSAALIHRLDLLNEPAEGLVWITRAPGTYRGCSVRGTRFHSASLPKGHVTTLHGVMVTTATRTVVDLARSLPFMEGVVTADSALRLGKTTKSGLLRMLRSCAGWPGIDQARRVIGFSNELSESALESCARVVFAEWGLPTPALQVDIIDGQLIGRVDFYWHACRTVAEADGMAKYENPQRAKQQIRRDNLLREAGYKVVHFTWTELFTDPARVVARVRRAFDASTAY